MRAGKLDKVLQLQSYEIVGDDGYGNPVLQWTTYATLRGQIVQASTEEFMRSFGASSETAIVFRVRYLDNVYLGHRVQYDGRPHDIKELKEIGRRRGLEIRTARIG